MNMPAAANGTAQLIDTARVILSRLLESVDPPEELLPQIEAVKQQLATDLRMEDLGELLEVVGGFLVGAWRRVDQERVQWNTFLGQLTERLDELNKSLQGTEQQMMAAYYGGRKAESTVERQVDDIEARLHRTSDVGQIKSYIHQRVAVIRTQLEDNQGRGTLQFTSLQRQLNTLRAIIQEIQQESAELRTHHAHGQAEVLVDPATGLASRWAYEQRLQDEIARWKRYRSALVVQLWSVDDFEMIKVAYGQKACDKALQLVAKIMETNLRETDFIARYEAGTLAVLLSETDMDVAQSVTDRICSTIAGSGFHYRGTPVTVTVSCGYSGIRQGDIPEDLLQRAFTALNQAVSEGGSRHCVG